MCSNILINGCLILGTSNIQKTMQNAFTILICFYRPCLMPEVRWWYFLNFFSQQKRMNYLLSFLFIFFSWKEWNGHMHRQEGTGKPTISNGLLLSLLHMSVYTLGKVRAQPQSLYCLYNLLFHIWITPPLNLVSGSRKSLELCARTFSISKTTCVHWGPLYRKDGSHPALHYFIQLTRACRHFK